MVRVDELRAIFKEADESLRKIVEPMLDDAAFLEDKLRELRALPFLRVDPDDNSRQKATPAAKQYKELLQQYNNCVKILISAAKNAAPEEESPLRAYLKRLNADD